METLINLVQMGTNLFCKFELVLSLAQLRRCLFKNFKSTKSILLFRLNAFLYDPEPNNRLTGF